MDRENLRMQSVQPPIIPIVGELIRNTPGTISLGQGVVYYSPPEQAIAQLSHFLADPENHKYKAVHGIPALLEVIEAKLKAENGIAITDQNCLVVSAGSNMAFMNVILAITSPGDEIILQTPYYFNHDMAIAMASCRPVMVATNDHYQLCPQAIQQAISDRTRAVVTISPNNPSGVVYSQASLQAVNEICRKHGIYHIHDEAYEYFTYGVDHFSPGSLPDSAAHTISLFTLSKAYGFASWRIGYAVMPKQLLPAVHKIQDTLLICPPVICQYAAVGALQVGVSYCREKLTAIAAVRDLILNELDVVQDICTRSAANGAFYVLLKLDTDLGSFEVVERLIREHGVAVIPGTTFGLGTGCYLRIAYGALQQETARAGVERLIKGLRAIAGSRML